MCYSFISSLVTQPCMHPHPLFFNQTHVEHPSFRTARERLQQEQGASAKSAARQINLSVLHLPSSYFYTSIPTSFLTFGKKPAHIVHWTGKKYCTIITHVNCIIHSSSLLHPEFSSSSSSSLSSSPSSSHIVLT